MRLTLNKTTKFFAALAVVSLIANTSSAAIMWTTTAAVNAAGDLSVDTTDSTIYAYNLGSADTHTVNGVTFDGTAPGGVGDLNGEGNVVFNPVDNGTNANFNNAGGDIEGLLDSAQWATPSNADTVTLGNLVPGQEYLVQLFTSDTRGSRNNTLRLDSGEAGQFDLVPSGSGNAGAYAIGTFTADANGEESFTFVYEPVNGNANLNAIQVRGPAAVPEPASAALIGLFAIGAGFFRRR